jgi:hypothetical protein
LQTETENDVAEISVKTGKKNKNGLKRRRRRRRNSDLDTQYSCAAWYAVSVSTTLEM